MASKKEPAVGGRIHFQLDLQTQALVLAARPNASFRGSNAKAFADQRPNAASRAWSAVGGLLFAEENPVEGTKSNEAFLLDAASLPLRPSGTHRKGAAA